MKRKKINNIISFSILSLIFMNITMGNIEVKAFPYQDAELKGAELRQNSGSNYWLSSNLREWLNSDDTTVRYTSNPPATPNVNSYPYDKEAGFLSSFTETEKNAIAITERGNVFGADDTKANTNGKTGSMPYNHNNSKSMNFEYPGVLKNWANYGQVVANDKVFLLTYKEMAEYVQNRGWTVTKTPSLKVTEKFGYSQTTKLPYYIYHPIQNIGNEYLEIVSANDNAISMDTNAKDSRGLVPAIHLKKDYVVKRIKEYNIYSTTESYTVKTSNVKASDLNIGDIVEFGSHLGGTITWRVINKTEEGYPLLLSENVIDIKAFDASGDYSRRFSYIDLEDKFPVADVSTKNFQITNIQNSTDKTQTSVQLLNEEKLFERSNDKFTMNLKLQDDSGIAYITFPNNNRVYVNNTEYTFNYEVGANGNYEFGIMDVKGNFRYYVLPIGNINLAPKVDITSSNTNWTNGNVSVNIKATNDVGWSSAGYNQSVRDISGGYWGNYTTYIGKQIRVTGTVEYISDKNGLNPSSFSYGPAFTYKRIAKSGDEYNLSWNWPMPWSENLNTLKNRTLAGTKTNIDYVYTVGSDYFGSFGARTHIGLTALTSGNTTIKWTNLKYELLDNSDFAITKIQLPNGNFINSASYTDTISSEGETTYSYKVHDNRNMVTEKTIVAKIDKSKPIIDIQNIPTEYTKDDVTLKLNFSDTVSGIYEVILPNGRISGDGKNNISTDYVITENGSYTFKVTDLANNTTTQTIVIDKIDKTAPTITFNKEISNDKLSGFININVSDIGSGVSHIVLPDNSKISNTLNHKYLITNNGYYNFIVYDNVGLKANLNVYIIDLISNITNSGISKIEYMLEGATVKGWTIYTSPFEVTNEGITTIRARAYDEVGNISYEKISYVKIDKTNPVNNSVTIQLN